MVNPQEDIMSKAIILILGLLVSSTLAADICENQADGARLAHPADCSKFIVCEQQHTAIISSCPTSLHFNRLLGECDFKETAGCEVFLPMARSRSARTVDTCDCSCCCSCCGCSSTPTPDTTVTPPCDDNDSNTSGPDTTVDLETDAPVTESTVTPDSPNTTDNSNAPDTDIPPTDGSDSPPTDDIEIPVTDIPVTSDTPNTDNPTTLVTDNPVTSDIPTTVSPDTPVTDNPVTPDTPVTDGPVTPDTPVTDSPVTPNTPITPDTPVTDSPDTPITPVTPGTPPTNNNCDNDLTVCVGRNDSIIEYDGDCTKYIVCRSSCAIIMQCPSGLYYNFETNSCDYRSNVDCPWTPPPAVVGPSGVSCVSPGKCLNQKEGTMFSDGANGYIVCQCNCEVYMPCPVDQEFDNNAQTCVLKNARIVECPNNLIYNSILDICDWPSNVSVPGESDDISTVICKNPSTACQNETLGAIIPVEGICDKFYKCDAGCAFEFQCQANLIFNPNLNICDFPMNYKCPWDYTAPSGPTAGPSGTSCPSGGLCVGKREGTLLPIENNANSYVVCQCECEVVMKCPDNLVFDANQNTCTWPVA